MAQRRFVGVTVLPEYLQSEGVDKVLDRLVTDAKVTAVATSPYLMEPTDEKNGKREPPADAGAGAVRLLDRPLWGKRELFVRTAPSFVPDKKLYKGLRYQPTEPTKLTREQGKIIHDFIKGAQSRHLKAYLQVQAVIPPGYRVQFGGPTAEDRPRLPDGSLPEKRLAKNGSLASEQILGYEHALLRDLIKNYPNLDGIRVDWPEYPPYFFDSLFLDFSDHAKTAAKKLDFDFEQMKNDVGGLYKRLHGSLTDADLLPYLEDDQGRYGLLRMLSDNPGILEMMRFKATLVERMLAGFREVMDDAGGKKMELMPNAFPPPWTLASGMDFRRVAKHSAAISCKLYTMHWPMMLRFYADQLMKANPKLTDKILTRALVQWLDLADDEGFDSYKKYNYPGPDVPHPVGSKAQARKIAQAQRDAGETPVYVLAHGYGPIKDYEKRLGVAAKAGKYGFWVNRYAYLTNEKIKLIGKVVENVKPEK